MRTIRSLTTLAGLSLVLFALGVVGAKGQATYSTHFAGTFTFPSQAQWGKITLPAGEYTMQYGVQDNGHGLVVVRGTAKGSPHGVILAGPMADSSTKKNSLICIRDGDTLVVRALEMPSIRESVQFELPPGTQRAAQNGKHSDYNQLAEAPMLIERITVTLNAQ
jgi:hypothetical protein